MVFFSARRPAAKSPALLPVWLAALVWFHPAWAAPRLEEQSWPETGDGEWVDLGAADGFYRNTQMQGHLTAGGQGLETVPDFWTTGGDFPYRKRDSAQEIFFTDHFSVTRFLGGFSQKWKHGGTQLPENDLAFVDESGQVRYRTELIGPRLQRYIDHGYTEFTIGMENVPWALSRDPSKSGHYGSTEPPRDWKEWSAFVEAVCRGIQAAYPEEVIRKLRFKVGNEFNGKESFTGSHDDFRRYYWETLGAIRKVFPQAPVMPGEFAGKADAGSSGVDYVKLFRELGRGRDLSGRSVKQPAAALVRSTHSFPGMKDIGPRERVESAVGSFREILRGVPAPFRDGLSFEYSQFGVLGSKAGESANDTGVRAASWQFQTLFRARASGFLDRCWAWDKSEKISEGGRVTHFLNGVGWLYSVLDHLRGDRAWLVRPRQPEGSRRDVSAVVFTRPDRIVIVLASWSPRPSESGDPERVVLRFPRKDLPFLPDLRSARTVALDNSNSVVARWRSDLAAAGNLQPSFAPPGADPSTLAAMAKDPAAARRMVFERLSDYEAVQQKSLTLEPLTEGLAETPRTSGAAFTEIEVQFQPNDLRVLVFGKTAGAPLR